MHTTIANCFNPTRITLSFQLSTTFRLSILLIALCIITGSYAIWMYKETKKSGFQIKMLMHFFWNDEAVWLNYRGNIEKAKK